MCEREGGKDVPDVKILNALQYFPLDLQTRLSQQTEGKKSVYVD